MSLINRYNRKRRIRFYILISLLIFLILTFIFLPTLILKNKDEKILTQAGISKKFVEYKNNADLDDINNEKIEIKSINLYTYNELFSVLKEESNEETFDISVENNIITEPKVKTSININGFDKKNNYVYEILLNNNEIKKDQINDKSSNINIEITKEGVNNFVVNLYENNNEVRHYVVDIYYIKPYEKQFLEELSNKGTAVHFPNDKEDYNKSNEFLKYAGIENVRTDLFYAWTIYNGKNYNFDKTDKWYNYTVNNNVKILPILNGVGPYMENKKFPSTQSDYEHLNSFVNEINNRYDINEIEILNEPNFTYKNEEDINKYGDLVNEIKQKNTDINLIVGALAQKNSSSYDPYEFFKLINSKTYKNAYAYSYHFYNPYISNYIKQIVNFNNLFNEFGGFLKSYLTEYGYTSVWSNKEDKAKTNVKQYILADNYNIDRIYQYNFVSYDSKGNQSSSDYNLGMLSKDYEPEESFYSIKNYNLNTNGAEYIGSFTLQDGITAYVYDKDGKPKIIIWSDNGEKKIDYTNFKASDLYGNEINPDENNQITVSDSPIYLDNISTDYFYQAISNAITSGYSEFNTKFADEISKVDGLTAKINELNKQAVNLKNVSTFDENKAKELMKEHFELGNMIMSAYENGKLNVEYVKLSSMLDSLNTIGNSYEDLVTVSAKTRITDLSDITNEVNTAKSLAQDNEKFDIVYPNKIYQFAQDFLDTSSYILGLEEENDIKTGLINSKALHAKYLAEWSQEFSKIYMKDALKDSLNKIETTNQEIKQNYSNILLNNEVSSCYNGISDLLKEISENVEKCNLDKVDSLYNKELDFAEFVATKYYSKELNIQESDFKALEKQMFETLNSYEGLYKYYVTEDSISQDEVINTLNKIVELYNDNLDIDLSTETEMIKNLKSTYEGLNSVEDSGAKYFEKLNIEKSCELIKIILDGDIENKADTEYKEISSTSNVDLSNYTNQDVIVSLKLPSDKVKITNNNESGNVTFSQNGEFTYEMEIRGYKYTYKVTVNNIDKTSPKLEITSTGTSIKSTATDENLKELKVEKDGKNIPYNQGEEITTPGIYQITAIDQANNQTTSKEIIYGTFKNTNNNDVKYVPINANKLKAKTLKENADLTIKNDNKEIADDANVATGNKLVKDDQEYTIIVKGDITKNGQVGTLDLIALRKNIVGLTKLENEQALAADLDDDGKINVLDLINERKKMIGLE